ncbi:MAG TPA: hypothetical protein VHX44_00175, partial [Planctomycetota bacterium]|nr:hypothetical protein [Planctomycetota bacterium]
MLRRLHPLLIPALLSLGTSASAAVYGLPEPPTPAPTPQAWFLFSDDFLGMAVLNTDDYRTANLTMGGRWDAWRFAADASMLTNRGRDGSTPSRSDELTYSLGYAVVDREREEKWRALLTLGVGGRTYGDLGGESVQNWIHDTFGYKTVHIPYDPEHGTDGLVFYHARLTGVPPWEYQLSEPFSRWAVQVESGGLVSTGDEQQLYGGVNLVSLGVESMAWIGARYQWHNDTYLTITLGIVNDKESGWWVVVGLSRTPGILITASINPDRETVAGTLGLTIDSQALPNHEGGGYRVDQSLKFFPGGGNTGLDIRWQPAWLAEHSLSPRDTLVLCYDFGAVAAYDDWQDCYVGFDQLVVGWAPTWNLPIIPRLAWSISAYGAAGVRLERVQKEDGAPRFTDDRVHVAGVLQG